MTSAIGSVTSLVLLEAIVDGIRRGRCSEVPVDVRSRLPQLEGADVPDGTWLSRGNLTLQVSADRHMLTKIEATGGFGGSTWTLLIRCASAGASQNPEASENDSP